MLESWESVEKEVVREREKTGPLLLLGECIDRRRTKPLQKRWFYFFRETHLRMKATEPFLRASSALSDAFLAATIWATLTPVWARACACVLLREEEAKLFSRHRSKKKH